jgi:fumarate reductase flavoprotein subunit
MSADDARHDVVIVGGGLAGLVAANRAQQLGLRALVLEAGDYADYACNTRLCGGVFHVSFTTIAHRPKVLADAIADRTYGHAPADQIAMMVDNTGRVLPWLRAEGVNFVRGGHEQYLSYVLAPPKWNRPGLDWRGRGGDVLVRTLTRNLLQRRGEISLATRAVELLMDGQRCVGVAAMRRGRREEFRAGAVVLADGGFQADPDMLARNISPAPNRVLQRNARSGVGDGARMAGAIGAELVGLGWFYGHLLSADAHENPRLWPYPVLDHLAAASLIIDGDGRRFTDEGLGGIAITNAVARLDGPRWPMVIFDERAWRGRPGTYHTAPPNPHLEREHGTLHRASSLEGLAAAAGFERERFLAAVAEYNAALAAGTLDKLDPPRTETRAKAMPVATPPFYAAPACAGITYTMGGVHITPSTAVLRADGTTIEGLHAAGSTTGGLEGGPGAGYVGGLGKASVTGLLAAEAIKRTLDPRNTDDLSLQVERSSTAVAAFPSS